MHWSDDEEIQYTGTFEEGDFDEAASSDEDVGEAEDELSQLLALNLSYSILVERLIEKAERSLEVNRELQVSTALLGDFFVFCKDQQTT